MRLTLNIPDIFIIRYIHVLLSVWFVRLYGKIIHGLQRTEYRHKDHTLSSLLHNYAFVHCALGDIDVKHRTVQ